MLLNLSQNYSEKRDEINRLIGKPFNMEDREKLGGTSLNNIPVSSASIDLYNLMALNQGISFSHLEIRPKGLMVSFQAGTDTYCLVIPFYKLKVYKGTAEEYSFYKDHYFIKIRAAANPTEVHQFIRKLNNFRRDSAGTRIEDV